MATDLKLENLKKSTLTIKPAFDSKILIVLIDLTSQYLRLQLDPITGKEVSR